MLSLLKKKTDASAAPLVPPWHPNFRNYEKLPDVKVVRTAFFINGAAIALVLVLGLYGGFREYQLLSLNRQIDDWQAQIEKNEAASNQAVAQFRKFQEEEKKIVEVNAFITAQPVVSDLLLRLSETRPRNIAFTGLEIRALGITVRAVVRGAPDLASGEAQAYLEILRTDPNLGPRLDGDPKLTSLNRDSSTGRLNLELFLKFKEPKKS